MIKVNHGHIVTVSSVAGLLGTYNCTDYSATKFATIGFHESLVTELKVKKNFFVILSFNLKWLQQTILTFGFIYTYIKYKELMALSQLQIVVALQFYNLHVKHLLRCS